MAIYIEVLDLAKMGLEKPAEAFEAAKKILKAAWDVAYRPGYTAKSSYLRELMPFIAEDLMKVAAKPQSKAYFDLVEYVRESDSKESMLELFNYAWTVAHEPEHSDRWGRMMSLVTVLFLVANHECQ